MVKLSQATKIINFNKKKMCFFFLYRLTTPLNSNSQQMPQNNAGPHCQMSGSSPLVMPGFPLRTSHSAHTPHYSPYSPSRYTSKSHTKINIYLRRKFS